MGREIAPFFNIFPGFAFFVDFLVITIPLHFAIASKGEKAQPVFYSSDFLFKNRLAPAYGKGLNSDSHKTGGNKMPQLMDKYHYSKSKQSQQYFID
jgi:hypothetical protein